MKKEATLQRVASFVGILMATKGPLSVLLPVAIFLIAAGAVYFSFSPRRTEVPQPQATDKLPGVAGLNEGDVVNLPALSTLDGQSVPLGQLKEKRVLCVFFSPSCSGCTKDVELWRDLKDESLKRGAAFYIIDVGSDDEALQKLVAAYKLEALPILFDPNHRIGPALKINFVPSYLLFASNGKVLHRWDGVRNYERAKGVEQINKFFQYNDD